MGSEESELWDVSEDEDFSDGDMKNTTVDTSTKPPNKLHDPDDLNGVDDPDANDKFPQLNEFVIDNLTSTLWEKSEKTHNALVGDAKIRIDYTVDLLTDEIIENYRKS